MPLVNCPDCNREIEVYPHEYGTLFECAKCECKFVPEATLTEIPVSEARRGYSCPFCHTDSSPAVRSEVTAIGWVFFIILLCSILFFWLCWLPLVVMRQQYRQCSSCGIRLD